jgi:hypothetical protein
VLPLIRTLYDITLLRKGPEAIPPAWLLLVPVTGLWTFSMLAAAALIDRYDESVVAMNFFSAVIGLLCYAAVVAASGRGTRMVQTIAAVIGCGTLIFMAAIAEYVLLQPILGEDVSADLATLINLWSVPVEGHIIARAIDRHWYIGILIAMGVFVLQLVVLNYLSTSR